jgi:hypothetical protein
MIFPSSKEHRAEGIASKIPNHNFQIPNKLQIPTSNDPKEFVSNFCDLNLFGIWCLGFGASI